MTKLSDGETRFIGNLLGDGEKLLAAEWVRKWVGNREEKRIIAITTYRFFSCKKQKLTNTRTVQRESHLYNLKEITTPNNISIRLQFKAFKIHFQPISVPELLQVLTGAIRIISNSFPKEEQPRSNILPEYTQYNALKGLENVSEGKNSFLNIYRAACVHLEKNFFPNGEFMDFIRSLESQNLDLSKYPCISQLSLQPVVWALRHDCHFDKLKIPLVRNPQTDLLLWVSDIFRHNKTLTSLSVSHPDGEQILEWCKSWEQNQKLKLKSLEIHIPIGKQGNAFCSSFSRLACPLEYLNLSDCELQPKAVGILFSTLSSSYISHSLQDINMEGNIIGEEGSKSFCELLQSMGRTSFLQTINFSRTNPKVSEILPSINNYLKHSLTTLNLSGVNFQSSTTHISSLAQCLETLIQLETLILSHCSITENLASQLLQAISRNHKLPKISLDISFNEIGSQPSSIQSFQENLQQTQNLSELNLIGNPLTQSDWAMLLLAFYGHSTFRRLHVSSCQNAEDTPLLVSHIKDLLQVQPLECLTLAPLNQQNTFQRKLSSLCDILEKNSPLRQLDIRNNRCGDGELISILNALTKNSSLIRLKIDGNSGTIRSWRALYDILLQDNFTLSSVDIPHEDIREYLITAEDQGENIESLWKNIQSLLSERKTSKRYQEYRSTLTQSQMKEIDTPDDIFSTLKELMLDLMPEASGSFISQFSPVTTPTPPNLPSLAATNLPPRPPMRRAISNSLLLREFNQDIPTTAPSAPIRRPPPSTPAPTPPSNPVPTVPQEGATRFVTPSRLPNIPTVNAAPSRQSRPKKKLATKQLFDSVYQTTELSSEELGTIDPLYLQEISQNNSTASLAPSPSSQSQPALNSIVIHKPTDPPAPTRLPPEPPKPSIPPGPPIRSSNLPVLMVRRSTVGNLSEYQQQRQPSQAFSVNNSKPSAPPNYLPPLPRERRSSEVTGRGRGRGIYANRTRPPTTSSSLPKIDLQPAPLNTKPRASPLANVSDTRSFETEPSLTRSTPVRLAASANRKKPSAPPPSYPAPPRPLSRQGSVDIISKGKIQIQPGAGPYIPKLQRATASSTLTGENGIVIHKPDDPPAPSTMPPNPPIRKPKDSTPMPPPVPAKPATGLHSHRNQRPLREPPVSRKREVIPPLEMGSNESSGYQQISIRRTKARAPIHSLPVYTNRPPPPPRTGKYSVARPDDKRKTALPRRPQNNL